MIDSALLIVDIQNDYFPGGAMQLEGADAAGANAVHASCPIFSRPTKARSSTYATCRCVPGATFFLPGTRGAEIHSPVQPVSGETVIEKNFRMPFAVPG